MSHSVQPSPNTDSPSDNDNEKFGVNAIREKFLAYFEERGHLRLPSFPLVPKNDNSLLLINAGMAPMKPYFTGQEIPPSKRVATCQKCIRTTDVDDVGKDARHGSFFEMLGNFSFGDYFKAEIIAWAWTFLTDEMGIPADKLYVSVYEEDDEAYQIWRDTVGLAPERIFRLGKDDNFWEHGVGPCGPCSEIHYDRGAENGCGQPDCTVGCDCDRFMEVWNLVFTQFNKQDDGSYTPLDSRNIDTGMGLERLAVVMQNADSIYGIDTLRAIRAEVVSVLHKNEPEVSVNIITDHIRSVTFMAADGVLPSNEGCGYVLRRLLRRAVRHGKLLGSEEPFITRICRVVIDVYGAAYPELIEKSDYIEKILSIEENRFLETLDTGLSLLKGYISRLREQGSHRLSGADAFRLYDTYGFPLELTQEILSDEGLTLDDEGFTLEMENQKTRARAARGVSTYMGAKETVYHQLDTALTTTFVGYTENSAEVTLIALVADEALAELASQGQAVSVFLDRSPFYAESGGQKGDSGVITTSAGAIITVDDCVKVVGGKMAHRGVVTHGEIHVGDKGTAEINRSRRHNTASCHSATHLLQKALREVLGGHVEQAGSEVSAERLRFDFTHFEPVSQSDLERVETIVNDRIMAGLPITVQERTLMEAREMGATALFGEKYGDMVRVVDMGGYSIELCGGTHQTNTQSIGLFKIMSESGVASGVRRIEAVTGAHALACFREADARLREVAAAARITPEKLAERVAAVIHENKQMRNEINSLKAKLAGGGLDALLESAETCGEFTLLAAKMDGMDANGLRTMCDRIKEKIHSGFIILCGVNDSGAQFLAYATDDAVKAGAHAGLAVKEAAAACGGGGGGRPNTAQAGGKDSSCADEALKKALAVVRKQLGA